MNKRMRSLMVGAVLAIPLVVSIGFADLPVVPGFSVEVYAEPPYPVKLCFGPDGEMYTGFNGPPSPWAEGFISRIAPGGGPDSVTPYGNEKVYDPDPVAYDATGQISGYPGSVITGGINSQLVAIHPDGLVEVLWTGPFSNPSDIAFDSTGCMLIVDGTYRGVFQTSGEQPTLVFQTPHYDASIIVVGEDDNIYINDCLQVTGGSEIWIRGYDRDGVSLGDPLLHIPLAPRGDPPFAFGPGGLWGNALYVIANSKLLRLELPGEPVTIGTGFASDIMGDMVFGPDGAMYVSNCWESRILRIAPLNSPPVAICRDVTVEAGPGCVSDASIDNGSYDPDGDEIMTMQDPLGPYQLGTTDVTLNVTDSHGSSASCTAIVTVVDTTPPLITLNGDATIILECGIDVYEDHGAIALDICDPEISVEIGGDTVDTSICGTYVVTYDATDDSGNDAIQVTRTVTVEDTLPPEIIAAIIEPQVVEVGQPVNFDSVVDDECGFTVEWDFGDGNPATTENPTTHIYDSADIYTVTLTATDSSDDVTTEEFFVVVYDPTAGFVTGGGWIWSPQGTYLYMDVEGKANFGFVSKYQKGANVPTGQTEFVFQAGDLNFHSSSYEWLVVTGSDYARFKGAGTINSSGEYKFMLWAGDSNPDTFRIKIWTEDELGIEDIVYDNGMDQPIGGGSIVIHTK